MEPRTVLLWSAKQMSFRIIGLDELIERNLLLMPATTDYAIIGLFHSEQAASVAIQQLAVLKGLVWSYGDGKWKSIS